MCLISFIYKIHPQYKLILVSNRDEFRGRKTKPAGFWQKQPQLLAGMDVEHQGTWLGVTKQGRFSAITNFRDGPRNTLPQENSRGHLVRDYLLGNKNPFTYLFNFSDNAGDYEPFNLLVGDKDRLCFYSNKERQIWELEAGVYALSNHLLNTPWPKTQTLKEFMEYQAGEWEVDVEKIFNFMLDTKEPDDDKLPDTGVGIEWERRMSPLFVTGEDYGTVSSTVILWDNDDNIYFAERTYRGDSKKFALKEFKFKIEM
ncbi:MAG: NRDE family protein [bacterium]|nr:NRDE family protein [bacterium]MBU1916813.1 NRDE family protein [bacterium]